MPTSGGSAFVGGRASSGPVVVPAGASASVTGPAGPAGSAVPVAGPPGPAGPAGPSGPSSAPNSQ